MLLTLVLTGSNGLTTTATTGIITAATIDATNLSGAFVMNVAAASGVTTITGGSGADTLRGDASSTISGGAGIDTIIGGSGNDTLNGGDGNDLITTGAGIDAVDGGAGDDTFTVVGNITATDTFEGGTGTDTISLNNASLTTLNALTVSEANTFNAGFNNVEKLTISDALNQTSFDIGYLDSLNHVTVTTQTGAETLNGFDSGDTIELTTTKAGVLTTGVNNASTGTSDVLNVLLTDGTGNAEDFGDIAIANVETINVTTREATADASDSASTLGIAVTQVTDELLKQLTSWNGICGNRYSNSWQLMHPVLRLRQQRTMVLQWTRPFTQLHRPLLAPEVLTYYTVQQRAILSTAAQVQIPSTVAQVVTRLMVALALIRTTQQVWWAPLSRALVQVHRPVL